MGNSHRDLTPWRVNDEPLPISWSFGGVNWVLIVIIGANKSRMGVGGEGVNELNEVAGSKPMDMSSM